MEVEEEKENKKPPVIDEPIRTGSASIDGPPVDDVQAPVVEIALTNTKEGVKGKKTKRISSIKGFFGKK